MTDPADESPIISYILEHLDNLWESPLRMFRRGGAAQVHARFPEYSLSQIKYQLRKVREEYIVLPPDILPEAGSPQIRYDERDYAGDPGVASPIIPVTDSRPKREYDAEDEYDEVVPGALEEIPESVHELITGVYADKADGVLNKTEIRLMALCAELMFEVDRLTSDLAKVRR